MTFDEYISTDTSIVIRKNPPVFPQTKMDYVIQNSFSDAGIDFKSIATNYVFPRVLRFDKKCTLIWDLTFFQLFSEFIIALADFSSDITSPSEKHTNTGKRKLQYIFSNFLALIIKDPVVSNNFASFYHSNQNSGQVFKLGISIAELNDYMEISKFFTAIHERYHAIIETDILRKEKEVLAATELLDIAAKLVENMSQQFTEKNYYLNTSDLLSLLSDSFMDENLKIDLICDTYAFNTSLYVFQEIWKNRLSQKEIVTKCFEAIRVLSYFNSSLLGLRCFWQYCECNVSSVNLLQKERIHRSYLAELFFLVQLSAQRLDQYLDYSLLKFNGFEDNYKLESLIYSYFFSDDAINIWKKTSQIKDRYELLNWRI